MIFCRMIVRERAFGPFGGRTSGPCGGRTSGPSRRDYKEIPTKVHILCIQKWRQFLEFQGSAKENF